MASDSNSCIIRNQRIDNPVVRISSPLDVDDTQIVTINFSEDKNVKFLPNSIASKFPNVVKLQANGCSLRKVTKLSLRSLIKLKVLMLNNNAIVEVEPEAFYEIFSVEIILLNNNRIEYVSKKTFFHLKKLEKLTLNLNKIQILHEHLLVNNPNLKEISLGGNKLISFNSKILEDKTNLKFVDLSNNPCINTKYPVAISLLEMISTIDLNCSTERLDISRDVIENLYEESFDWKFKYFEIEQRDEALSGMTDHCVIATANKTLAMTLFELIVWPFDWSPWCE